MKRATGRRGCGRALAAFEAAYKLGAMSLFLPLLLGGLSLLMKVNGYAYLTHENIGAFFTRPLTVLALVLLLVAVALYVMSDVSAVLFAMDRARRGMQTGPGQIARAALGGAVRACRRKNLPVIPVTLCLLPLSCAGLAAGFLAAVSIPAVIPRYLRAHPALPISLIAAAVVMTALGVRWLYTVCCFAAEGCTFSEARRRGAALCRGRYFRDLAVLLAVQGAFAIAGVGLPMALAALAGLLGKLFALLSLPEWVGASALWLAAVLGLAVIGAAAVPVGYGCAGALYCRRAGAGAPEISGPASDAPAGRGGSRRARIITAAVLIAAAAGSLTWGLMLGTGGINPEIEYLRTVQITAHRGASAFFPENTMAAFAGAMDLGADWIELDVQQSRDGRLVVAHDANLRRTTGVDANTWELTYDEIEALDAGSSFGADFAGERIPGLGEVLDFARENGLRLNIELKPSGHEQDLEKSVVDAIRAAEMEEDCVVTSQSYSVLERVKAYDETVTTVYVMRLAYGRIDRLDAADNFSVAAESVTRSLVSRVHNAGRELYVWTVNSPRIIERMIELGVDNIITDDVDLAKQCVYESRYGQLLEDYVDLLQ